MKTINLFAPVALVMSIAVPAAAQTPAAAPAPAAANVLGVWDSTVTTSQGAVPNQISLKKDGEKIVGTISSAMGDAPVEAQVKGKDVTVWFNFQGQNGTMAVELNGAVDGDSIKGTIGIGGQPAGEWVASRAKDMKAAAAPAAVTATPASSVPSLSGTYSVSVELPNMTANPTITLMQTGDKLTGEYVSAQYGKFPITGTVKGTEVTFAFAMNIEGNGLDVTYKGVAGKDGAVTGTVTYGDMMSGTFTAKRK